MNLRMQYYFDTYCSSFYFHLTTYFKCKNIVDHLLYAIQLNLILTHSQYLKQIRFRF